MEWRMRRRSCGYLYEVHLLLDGLLAVLYLLTHVATIALIDFLQTCLRYIHESSLAFILLLVTFAISVCNVFVEHFLSLG